MLYLAFIFHMHQPYYKNLLTRRADVPWVRLHGIKDYMDMVQILEKYPAIHQTFNLVPSLAEQLDDYVNGRVNDRFLELSYKPAADLTSQEKEFILDRFFFINKDRVISVFPRYYELYLKRQAKKPFTIQDYLDLQVWFNLSWFDYYYRVNIPALRTIAAKGRFFTEEDKKVVLDKQFDILKEIIPTYRKFRNTGQIEVIISPYYHPILPLLYNTNIAKEANQKTLLPHRGFSFPQDAKVQIEQAVSFYKSNFSDAPYGMWPSEEAVSEHILPLLIESGIKWIVADEAILFRSLKKKKRETRLLYQPHLLRREGVDLNIVFRDRNLSDLIGFVYHAWRAEDAVGDFMRHLENTAKAFAGGSSSGGKDEDILVTIAMDGENAWEYYRNDGYDFLSLLYERISEAKFLKTVTIAEYLKMHPPKSEIIRLSPGSWIYADFSKWIGNPAKNRAWDYLLKARLEFEEVTQAHKLPEEKLNLAWKQMYVAEGSDWFWWYGDNQEDFDNLFRMHLSNFYRIIDKEVPEYLNKPITA